MATPPPIPPSPVLQYAVPQPGSPLWQPTDPALAFISRMSIWLGVLYALMSLPLLGVFALMTLDPAMGSHPAFWLSMVAIALLQLTAGIILMCGAGPARRKRVVLVTLGSLATTVTSAGFAAAIVLDSIQTTHMDYLPLAVVCLLFAAMSATLLLSCRKQSRMTTL